MVAPEYHQLMSQGFLHINEMEPQKILLRVAAMAKVIGGIIACN